MINIKKLRLFPFRTPRITIPNIPGEENFSIWFYGENIDFLEAFPRMRFRRQDCRHIFLPRNASRPRVFITPNHLKPYKEIKLIPLMSKEPKAKMNFFVDLSIYLKSFETFFNPQNYRTGLILNRINSYLDYISNITDYTKKVFIYCIDITKEFNPNIFARRIFPIISKIKNKDQLPFDYFVVCFMTEKNPIYTLFINPDKSLPVNRIFTTLKSIKCKRTGEETFPNEEIESQQNNIEQLKKQIDEEIEFYKIKYPSSEQAKEAFKENNKELLSYYQEELLKLKQMKGIT